MVPPELTRLRAAALPPRENQVSRRYLRVLEAWIPTGVQYFAEWPARPNCGHFLGGCHWYGIETKAVSLACALAASSPEYRLRDAGASPDQLRDMALAGLRYLCFTHDTGPADCVRPSTGLGRPENCGTKWGERGLGFFRESQCGLTLWAMAITALALGPVVDDETWTLLAAVAADYAERFGQMEPRDGVYFDTQMEENGWTACGLAAAELLLARHPMAGTWAGTARRWMFRTATAPQDTKDRAPYEDGQTVAQWTGRTFTTLPDYMAENHGMVHPSYTAAGVGFTGHLAAIYGAFGKPLPRQALFNRQRIYDQLKRTTDRKGCMHPVQGMDWPYLWPDPGTGTHATAALLLRDHDAALLERRALSTLEARQASAGGRMYDLEIASRVHDIQDPLIIRECAIEGPAISYLLHRLLGPGPRPTEPAAAGRRLRGVTVYPHSGFVFHRHRRGQTSLAWRNCVMALPLNSDGIYTVAPAASSFLAAVTVKGHPDSQHLVSVQIDAQDQGFAAAVVLDRAQGVVRQEVLFAGLPDGTSLSWERLVARRAVTVERLEQGFLRIVNERFPAFGDNCRGWRIVHTPNGSERFEGFVGDQPADDVVRLYERPAWLNVDDRLGIVFRGTGRTVYHNRHFFSPWWAVADDLILSRVDRPFAVRAGALAGELVALLAPDQAHRRTAGQALAVSQSRGGAVALIANGHLAMANFGARQAAAAFAFPHGPQAAVPVFAGSTRINQTTASYGRRLAGGAACLQRALAFVRADGPVEVTAAEVSATEASVLVRNPGSRPVRVDLQGAGTVRIAAGGIVPLPVGR